MFFILHIRVILNEIFKGIQDLSLFLPRLHTIIFFYSLLGTSIH
jgi:hypothetical protein